jgi:hypothetical protein
MDSNTQKGDTVKTKQLIKIIEASSELELIDLIEQPGIEQLARWCDEPEKEEQEIEEIWC